MMDDSKPYRGLSSHPELWELHLHFLHPHLHFLAQASCSLCILCSLDYPAPQRIPLGTTNTLRFMEYYELDLRSSVHFRTYAPPPSSRTEEYILLLLFPSLVGPIYNGLLLTTMCNIVKSMSR